MSKPGSRDGEPEFLLSIRWWMEVVSVVVLALLVYVIVASAGEGVLGPRALRGFAKVLFAVGAAYLMARVHGGRNEGLVPPIIFAGASALLVSLTLVFLVLFAGADLSAPTVALAVCGFILLFVLRTLYRMVTALAQPASKAIVLGERLATPEVSELRDERRRVVRAIKELEFDFSMGKLGQSDYDDVLARYKIRAIELSRALDGGALHPDVVALLAEASAAGQTREAGA